MCDERFRREVLRPEPGAAYRSTFAPSAPEPVVGEPLPSGWEGIYFPFDAAYEDLRPDGSPGGADVVPDVGLPRRMYAGEDTLFQRPLRYGDLVEQRTWLGTVTRKVGRSGEMVFADVQRTYSVDGAVAISTTWHDVFLPAADPSGARVDERDPKPVPATADWHGSETVTLDSRQLFRYSALTFNTHRVHYDRTWARDVEGLPDLLVHGPLIRMLLLDFAGRSLPDVTVSQMSLRSSAPAYVDAAIKLVGRKLGDGAELSALDAADRTLAVARVTTHQPGS